MQQFSEDQGTLSPPFSQPGGLSPGIWPAPRGPPPPRMQGPPPQGQMPGPHHPDQSRPTANPRSSPNRMEAMQVTIHTTWVREDDKTEGSTSSESD
ncbi:hypothetical protein JZ751_008847 [Albula glossodonta]|uniref:Uncharacterized protein n=1 Tax=Albula glossodonta TaxID=121402 RepID=A0A8T2NXD5_9TELE|nr:hypothetical protein JZ751_008847 [Albula glossodonta]